LVRRVLNEPVTPPVAVRMLPKTAFTSGTAPPVQVVLRMPSRLAEPLTARRSLSTGEATSACSVAPAPWV